ncbi:MAG: hypothetical protein LBM74_09095, partial [Oscillospiraceae bacterium]|nr:hypothetical protein [Oscillospiraceae bacterium]
LRCMLRDGAFITQWLPALPEGLSPAQGAALTLGEYTLTCGGTDFLWSLKRYSEPLVIARSLTLTRNSRGEVLRGALAFEMAGRHRFGLGERFDGVEQSGHALEIKVVEKFSHQGDQSYLPVPLCFSEAGIGWFRPGGMPVSIRLTERIVAAQEIEPAPLWWEDCWLLGDPQAILRQMIGITGAAVMPPEWAFGLWMSGNGWHSDADVQEQLDAIAAHDYPASVLVIEAWSDEQTFYRWNDASAWPSPADTLRRIREAGLHTVLWQIPVIKREWYEAVGEDLRRDEAEAIARGYCVLRGDGTPYRIPEKWFHGSLLPDFSNPEAEKWWFDKRRHLLDMGVEGFKTDGGEFLFEKTARLHNGMSGRVARNLYPSQYVAAYHRFMRSHGLTPLTFSRAGYAGAQTMPMHWAGDQLSEWSELQAQLSVGLSAGLSGVFFWGFDIGGFAGAMPTPELYLRATALGCFSPVMQWHSEPRGGQYGEDAEPGLTNDRSPWNLALRWHSPALLETATAFARLRVRLLPYIIEEAAHCVQAARPLMAHLCIDFPEDEAVWDIHDEYLFGRNLLVAPIVTPGQTARRVYLPRGRWRHFFTGEAFAGEQWITVDCPLDQMIVFEREG